MDKKLVRSAVSEKKIFTPEEIKRWEEQHHEDAIRDYRSDMRASWEEGWEEGLAEGIAERIKEIKTDVALEMLRRNMDTAIIAEVTEQSIADIQELKKRI